MTLGPGTFGGSIISENVSAKHLFNIKRLAFETRPINSASGSDIQTQPASQKAETSPRTFEPSIQKSAIKTPISHNIPVQIPKPPQHKSWMEEIEERIRLKAANTPNTKQQIQHPLEEKKPYTLGSGISEDEVERIIKEFSKR
jgi:acetaldehyde dehydrogenase (acetylating)